MDYIHFHRYSFDDAEREAVLEALASGWITRGPKTAEFEQAIAAYTGSPYAIALNSCTAGLHLALLGYDIGVGDEVITTPMTFVATANVIVHTGARPVFVDIEPETLNMNPALVEQAITHRTKAIIPVHFAGHPCDMDAIKAIARKYGLLVIEDAAHAIGATYKGQKIGGIADVTVFSFYATKNITTGEGGMLLTADQKRYDRLRPLSLHGLSHDAWARYSGSGFKHYLVEEPGYKYNMTDIQAALGLAQLPKCERFLEARAKQVLYYQDGLKQAPLQLLTSHPNIRHAHHLFVVKLECEKISISRDQLLQMLHERGIGAAVHFVPVHQHPFYRRLCPDAASHLPVTEKLAGCLLSLPLYPDLKREQMDYIMDTLCELLAVNSMQSTECNVQH